MLCVLLCFMDSNLFSFECSYCSSMCVSTQSKRTRRECKQKSIQSHEHTLNGMELKIQREILRLGVREALDYVISTAVEVLLVLLIELMRFTTKLIQSFENAAWTSCVH